MIEGKAQTQTGSGWPLIVILPASSIFRFQSIEPSGWALPRPFANSA